MRIIVLDDNFGIADALRTALMALGDNSISVVTRPQDLLEESRRVDPDAYVFDFLLPGEKIEKHIAELKKARSDILFIFFTLYADDPQKKARMMALCHEDERRIIEKEPDLRDCSRRIMSELERLMEAKA